jgi:hypothetical protein
MVCSSDRVPPLIAGRRAGTVTLKEFKRQIETFWPEELAELAAVLLEERPQRRQHLKQRLLAGFEALLLSEAHNLTATEPERPSFSLLQ